MGKFEKTFQRGCSELGEVGDALRDLVSGQLVFFNHAHDLFSQIKLLVRKSHLEVSAEREDGVQIDKVRSELILVVSGQEAQDVVVEPQDEMLPLEVAGFWQTIVGKLRPLSNHHLEVAILDGVNV